MALPRKTPNSVRYARMATRGCLTRLALMFQAEPARIWRGDEVAAILVEAVHTIGSPEVDGKCIDPPRQIAGAQDDRIIESMSPDKDSMNPCL